MLKSARNLDLLPHYFFLPLQLNRTWRWKVGLLTEPAGTFSTPTLLFLSGPTAYTSHLEWWVLQQGVLLYNVHAVSDHDALLIQSGFQLKSHFFSVKVIFDRPTSVTCVYKNRVMLSFTVCLLCYILAVNAAEKQQLDGSLKLEITLANPQITAQK